MAGKVDSSEPPELPIGNDKRLWRLAATAVLLEHVVIVSKDGPCELVPAQLSWWPFSLLENALPAILEELREHNVTIIPKARGGSNLNGKSEAAFAFAMMPLASAEEDRTTPELQMLESSVELRKLLAQVCAPMQGMDLDWLPSLGRTVKSIADVIVEDLGEKLDLAGIHATTVNHAVMFNEPWSAPYEICWQADGAGKCITMPDVPHFAERHFQHFAEYMDHVHPGQTVLYQFLGTYVIPCHEVLHIVQHLHGKMRDPDARSYVMEHDASRLNYVLLWHVLHRDFTCPPWFRWVVMLEAVNRTLQAQSRFSSTFVEKYPAYRRWADSFGLDSPLAAYAHGVTDEDELRMEGLSKILVAGEALGCRGGRCPSRSHLVDLLTVAFLPERIGDVYSPENRERVLTALPADLQLGEDAFRILVAPMGPIGEQQDRLIAALRGITSSKT